MKKLLFFVLASLCLMACTDKKEAAKAQLQSLYEDAVANSENYTSEDWAKFMKEYNQTDSILGTVELTDEERKEIGKIKGKCAVYMLKGAAAEAASKVKEATQELNGMLEGLVEGINEASK